LSSVFFFKMFSYGQRFLLWFPRRAPLPPTPPPTRLSSQPSSQAQRPPSAPPHPPRRSPPQFLFPSPP
jgi:hypothetical protein